MVGVGVTVGVGVIVGVGVAVGDIVGVGAGIGKHVHVVLAISVCGSPQYTNALSMEYGSAWT